MKLINHSQPMSSASADEAGTKGSGFKAFSGTGHRLDGKSKSSTTSLNEVEATERSLPQLTVNTNYIPGKLEFVRLDLYLFFEVKKIKVSFAKDVCYIQHDISSLENYSMQLNPLIMYSYDE